eukprot:gnl/Hemi2/6107_TR2110_c0_g1_i1.p1 gnl/Hemi2/6107_TR2110_c0_g1~~gnl/Hemi2/6107_TR2110_c0_g1_i1.p1  ORF type:complete len:257 (+),score=72.90 gnl/Hemi2/6107_TR2110_c0_g1_i1:110-880(+)
MYRAVPKLNEVCHQKWDDHLLAQHKKRRDAKKPYVDTSVPYTAQLGHLGTNFKKLQQLDDRFVEIERENLRMLNTIQSIHRNPSTLDNFNPHEALGIAVSAHRDLKHKANSTLQEENWNMWQRIKNTKPQINFEKWEGDYYESNKRVRSYLCRLPYVLGTPNEPKTSDVPSDRYHEAPTENKYKQAKDIHKPQLPKVGTKKSSLSNSQTRPPEPAAPKSAPKPQIPGFKKKEKLEPIDPGPAKPAGKSFFLTQNDA